MITPVLPFDTALDNALRNVAEARGRHALDMADAKGRGTLYGYYLAGAVPAITYKAARDRLATEATQRRALVVLGEELEDALDEDRA